MKVLRSNECFYCAPTAVSDGAGNMVFKLKIGLLTRNRFNIGLSGLTPFTSIK